VKSNWIEKDGKFKTYNLIPLAGNAFSNAGYALVMSSAWKLAKLGGLN
jgi:hypothetical protein